MLAVSFCSHLLPLLEPLEHACSTRKAYEKVRGSWLLLLVVIYLPLTVALAGSIQKAYKLARAACACTCLVCLRARS